MPRLVFRNPDHASTGVLNPNACALSDFLKASRCRETFEMSSITGIMLPMMLHLGGDARSGEQQSNSVWADSRYSPQPGPSKPHHPCLFVIKHLAIIGTRCGGTARRWLFPERPQPTVRAAGIIPVGAGARPPLGVLHTIEPLFLRTNLALFGIVAR